MKERTAVRALFEDTILPAFAERFIPTDRVLNLGAGSHDYRAAFPCGVITADPLPGCDEQFSAEQVPYPTSSLDGVLLMGVFERLDDPMLAMREIRRVLRPGGLLLLSALDLGFPWRKACDRWRVSPSGAAHAVRDFVIQNTWSVEDSAHFFLVQKPSGAV